MELISNSLFKMRMLIQYREVGVQSKLSVRDFHFLEYRVDILFLIFLTMNN